MPLSANSQGRVTGSFTIPANVLAGTKRVSFTGNQGNTGNGVFIGAGQLQTQNRQLITAVNVFRQVNTVFRWPDTPRVDQNFTLFRDPLAQTFTLEEGRHVTSVDVKFRVIGNVNNPVYIQIRETDVGLPTQTVLADGVIGMNGVSTTNWTNCALRRPVYLQPGVEYAIVFLTDDANHSLALAQLGRTDPDNGPVTSQPFTIGVLLKSSNASTWTPVQEADLTFRLKGARFTSNTRTVNLGQIRQAAVSSITRSGTTATATATGHGFTTGQKVVISGAAQGDYNGAFTVTVTGPNTFTYTVSGSPVTPATGTISAVIGDTSDIITLAAVEQVNNSTNVEFVYTRPDGGTIRGRSDSRIQLTEEVNVPLTLSAQLTGTPTLSPLLFAGTQSVYGNMRESANYITRAVPCAAGAKVSTTFEALIPAAASVTVEAQKSDGTWQSVAQTSTKPIGDGWLEINHTVASFTAGGIETRVRLTLNGTAAARPRVRQLRVVVI